MKAARSAAAHSPAAGMPSASTAVPAALRECGDSQQNATEYHRQDSPHNASPPYGNPAACVENGFLLDAAR
jgi:hypothetical protein